MPVPLKAVNVNTPVLLSVGPFTLSALNIVNATSQVVYVQLYNQSAASSVTLGSTACDWEIQVPPNGGQVPASIYLPATGLTFSAGLVAAVTQTDRGSQTIQLGVSLYYA